MKPLFKTLAAVATLAALVLAATACSGTGDGTDRRVNRGPALGDRDPGGTLTIYSRDREFSEPLFRRFEQQTEINVRARWGDPVELADQIIKDGAGSPADLFYAPLSDALGSLSAAGRLAELSGRQLDKVPAAYRSPDGTWVGTSGRAHVVFYNTDKLDADHLPDSILGFTAPSWRGRVGWDPTSRSLRDVVTELRQLSGEDAARRWLENTQANKPATFQGAQPVINAISAGAIIDVGFGSHSYLPYMQADGDATNVAAKFYPRGAPGGLLNVAGVGIIKGTRNAAAATAFVDFMLSPATQRYLVTDAYEIPLVKGITPATGTPTADELTVPGLNVRQFEQLQEARRLLTETGITG